jgi:cation:H+ antiporter
MYYLKFLGGLALLIFSAKYLVQGGVSIARHFKIPGLIIGLTIVAVGTSAPELIVSVMAAFKGNPEIAVGNVVGSNIANIALILAITAILVPIPVSKNSVRLDWPVMMFASLLLFLFVYDNKLVFYEGLIFIGLLILYLFILIKISKKEQVHPIEISNNSSDKNKEISIRVSVFLIIISSIGLAFGADFLVNGASAIAMEIGASKRVISLTIVAVGTSAPELTASIIAGLRKETDIAIGNIMGSNIINIFLVLGAATMIHEIPVDHIAFSFDMIWMIFISFLLLLFIYPFKTIFLNRVEGMLLLLAYLVYASMLIYGINFESVSNTLARLF